uniref:Uncharacterized protein n=1 Tax=Picea glauca TaxID=3330 RepID=A0A117NFF1_PICGL|nr:hypothetical protein ABT39_MTgene4045 [Picea glauca]
MFTLWHEKPELKEFKASLLILSLGIWLARNADIFEGKFIPPFQCASEGKFIPSFQCASQRRSIFASYITISKAIPERQLAHEPIDKIGA